MLHRSYSSGSFDQDGLVCHVYLSWLRTLSAAKIPGAWTTFQRAARDAHNTIVIARPSQADSGLPARPLNVTFIFPVERFAYTRCAPILGARQRVRAEWRPQNANAIIYLFSYYNNWRYGEGDESGAIAKWRCDSCWSEADTDRVLWWRRLDSGRRPVLGICSWCESVLGIYNNSFHDS